MIKDVTKNKLDYAVLLVISSFLLIFFSYNRNNPSLLFLSVIVFSISYVLWGVVHHIRIQTFKPKIVLEYVLVATLAVIVASSLLL